MNKVVKTVELFGHKLDIVLQDLKFKITESYSEREKEFNIFAMKELAPHNGSSTATKAIHRAENIIKGYVKKDILASVAKVISDKVDGIVVAYMPPSTALSEPRSLGELLKELV